MLLFDFRFSCPHNDGAVRLIIDAVEANYQNKWSRCEIEGKTILLVINAIKSISANKVYNQTHLVLAQFYSF